MLYGLFSYRVSTKLGSGLRRIVYSVLILLVALTISGPVSAEAPPATGDLETQGSASELDYGAVGDPNGGELDGVSGFIPDDPLSQVFGWIRTVVERWVLPPAEDRAGVDSRRF